MSERRDVWWFFDVDDVLYDATLLKRLARENAVVAMIEAGLPVDFDTLLRSVNEAVEKFGEDYPRHFDEALSSLGLRVEPRIVAAGVIAYHDTKRAFLKPLPNVFQTLIGLRDRGVKLGLSSPGNPVKEWEKVIRLGLHHLFERAWFGDADRERISSALAETSADPGKSFYVTARPEGIDAAKEAGLRAIRVRRGKRSSEDSAHAPDLEVISLWEVVSRVEGLLEE